jgi:hypothetical protein
MNPNSKDLHYTAMDAFLESLEQLKHLQFAESEMQERTNSLTSWSADLDNPKSVKRTDAKHTDAGDSNYLEMWEEAIADIDQFMNSKDHL